MKKLFNYLSICLLSLTLITFTFIPINADENRGTFGYYLNDYQYNILLNNQDLWFNKDFIIVVRKSDSLVILFQKSNYNSDDNRIYKYYELTSRYFYQAESSVPFEYITGSSFITLYNFSEFYNVPVVSSFTTLNIPPFNYNSNYPLSELFDFTKDVIDNSYFQYLGILVGITGMVVIIRKQFTF